MDKKKKKRRKTPYKVTFLLQIYFQTVCEV